MAHAPRRLAPVFVALMLLASFSACSTPTSSSTGPGASTQEAVVKVAIVSDPATIGAYSPPTATAKAGRSVEWSFRDVVPHTVTADGGGFDSGVTSPGGTFRHLFDQPGTYPYHCAIHPQMHGAAVVQ